MEITQSYGFSKEYALPPLPLGEWKSTKSTLHLYAQIVGKIRLKLFPKKNHWWHVSLYVSTRGITTGPIPYGFGSFEIELDLIDHAVLVRTNTGAHQTFPLYNGLSVAEFYARLLHALEALGVHVDIVATPYEIPDAGPFADDREHRDYDREYVSRYWRILVAVDGIMEEFRGRFIGKSTPVHLFWHSFDLALTRFSGRPVPVRAEANQVEREAYSHEVISFGFWAGDDNVPEPAFYSYVYPEPQGLRDQQLRPEHSFWGTVRGGAEALLMYEHVRASDDPRGMILDFFQSAYEAGARTAGWDQDAFALKTLEPAG
jgi:hypothetical protein